MRKGQGSVRPPRFDCEVLQKKILVDGRTLTINQATAEEFDMYVFSVLEQMYEKQYFLLRCYNESFDYDWSDHRLRVVALNELYRLNLARPSMSPARPKIPLFAQEEIPAC